MHSCMDVSIYFFIVFFNIKFNLANNGMTYVTV